MHRNWYDNRCNCALFAIGLKVDKPRPESVIKRKGSTIPVQRAHEELTRLRIEQVGRKAAAKMWFYDPLTESCPTIHCMIYFVPGPGEKQRRTFKKHMLEFAERTAELFGQREIWLWLGGRMYRANAPGEAPPKALRKP